MGKVLKMGTKRITKKEFYAMGGFANPSLYRKQYENSDEWVYYQDQTGYYYNPEDEESGKTKR